jgi:hypothetical protein
VTYVLKLKSSRLAFALDAASQVVPSIEIDEFGPPQQDEKDEYRVFSGLATINRTKLRQRLPFAVHRPRFGGDSQVRIPQLAGTSYSHETGT